jgi:hypothetical protein
MPPSPYRTSAAPPRKRESNVERVTLVAIAGLILWGYFEILDPMQPTGSSFIGSARSWFDAALQRAHGDQGHPVHAGRGRRVRHRPL